MTRRIALTIEYDGTELCGWQRQLNGPTVQEHVEVALSELLGVTTQVVGASRTDAGVHALGQVCHFNTGRAIPDLGIARGLNSLLPPSIAVCSARTVESDFHARFSARGKHYRYRILNRPIRSPLFARTAWHVRAALSLEAMSAAAGSIVGERDFSAFRATGCSAKTAVREVTALEVVTEEPACVVISVRGNAFLRNMVRIIAGTLVDVGRGRLPPETVKQIIESRDRTRAGQTAPAAGLSLVRVFY